jgi:arsenate reductase
MTAIRTVLVLCTGNSARSIMAEALFNRLGEGRLQAHSAGSRPKGTPNPHALGLLAAEGYDVSGFRSKSWHEFMGADAPRIDLVVTVCDAAAGEACPLFPGAPIKTHWGIPDPAAVVGSPAEIKAAFDLAYDRLQARVTRFLALPIDSLAGTALTNAPAAIGAMEGATDSRFNLANRTRAADLRTDGLKRA